ncbi:MAG: hypothetical protein OEW48_08520 [Phycisphaerae bacterium]|nr:hypothetical protein [Phycisphaerae bacterium]
MRRSGTTVLCDAEVGILRNAPQSSTGKCGAGVEVGRVGVGTIAGSHFFGLTRTL